MRKKSGEIKIKVIGLRKKGFSLSEISHNLNIPKSTIQGWVKNIQLTKLQRINIKEKILSGGCKGRNRARKVIEDKKELWKNNISSKATRYIKSVYKNSRIEKLICGILYLCEGAKYPSTRHLVFTNSDPRMIKLFLKLLKRNFKLDNKKFRCRIMHRWDQEEENLNKYWSRKTGIPLSLFYKSYGDKRTKGIATKKKNYKGICSIKYLDTNIQFELQAIGEAIF